MLESIFRRHQHVKRFLAKCWLFVAALFIVMAIVFSVFRALTPWARQYKPVVEAHLSTLLGQPVTIQSMETSWYWLYPVIRLNGVTVTDQDAHTLKLHKLLIGMNLLGSLWHWTLQPGIVYIDNTRLVFRQLNNRWTLDGLSLTHPDVPFEPAAYLPMLAGLSSQEKIVVRNLETVVHLQDGSTVPFNHVNLTVQNDNGHYGLKGTAQLDRATKTEFSIFADVHLNPLALNKTKGHFYLSAKSLLPAQWQGFLQHFPVNVLDGEGDATLWFDVRHGQLSMGQGLFAFRHLMLEHVGDTKPHTIDSVSVHLGWARTQEGWVLNGKHLQLRMNETQWPLNSFYVHHYTDGDTYHLFVKHVLLKPLLALDIPWPEALKPILAMKPLGELFDTKWDMKAQTLISCYLHSYVPRLDRGIQRSSARATSLDPTVEPQDVGALGLFDACDQHQTLTSFLTGFSDLSWQESGKIPAVSGLSGVLFWNPNEGRLALDSHSVDITSHTVPKTIFSQMNMALDWKKHAGGVRIALSHLVLQNPQLTLTSSGVLDKSDNLPDSQVHWVTEFSTENAEQWIRMIPAHTLKPKLDRWLKNSVQHIEKASGKMKVDGLLGDFPFDRSSGTFSIQSYISGLNLLIAPHWPLSRNINAYLSVDKRQLDVNIQHADLNDIVVDNMNLRMDDIGLEYDTLLLHGKIAATAEQLLAYLFKTPIGRHLSRLKSLDLRGLLGLDLKIEVPLYPENDDVLTQGVIQFDHNQAMIHFGAERLPLNNLTGSVAFNEKGVSESTVTATIMDSPVAIRLQPIQQPKPALQAVLQGKSTVKALRQMLHLPLLALMKGPLDLDVILTLPTDANEMDHLQIHSSLQGVRVALPEPLGKAPDVLAPLTAHIDFDANAMRLRLQYDQRLNTDMWYTLSQDGMSFNRGDIHLGSGDALAPQEKGLKISGSVSTFDEKKWTNALSKISFDATSPSLLDTVRWVDVTFDTFHAFHQLIRGVVLKATQLAQHEWSVQINQKDLVADVRYQPATHTLSGQVARLQLLKPAGSSQPVVPEADADALTPAQVPNLHLTLQHVWIGDVDVGEVALDTKSSSTAVEVTSCKVTTPSYVLNAKGTWLKGNAVSQSNIQAELYISSIEKSLERWRVKPALDGNKGTASFTGVWPGSWTDFSLRKVTGQLQILLKGGRITDLGTATEEKIGFGKLLSIFSLQTIPRRLKLDFSDLAENGYSFDQFKGDFRLKDGIMSTQNSAMDGPVASVSMKGDVDLLKSRYALEIYVSPHVTASLPIVAATIVGGPIAGPIAGIATWAASKILNQGIFKVTGYTYKVTGPWSDPVIEQLKIDKKRVVPS